MEQASEEKDTGNNEPKDKTIELMGATDHKATTTNRYRKTIKSHNKRNKREIKKKKKYQVSKE
jgi:hypothetical protein